jgi:hypothetical protein
MTILLCRKDPLGSFDFDVERLRAEQAPVRETCFFIPRQMVWMSLPEFDPLEGLAY